MRSDTSAYYPVALYGRLYKIGTTVMVLDIMVRD
jgi:hypothetical protein